MAAAVVVVLAIAEHMQQFLVLQVVQVAVVLVRDTHTMWDLLLVLQELQTQVVVVDQVLRAMVDIQAVLTKELEVVQEELE
jgi:hypothetical protein